MIMVMTTRALEGKFNETDYRTGRWLLVTRFRTEVRS